MCDPVMNDIHTLIVQLSTQAVRKGGCPRENNITNYVRCNEAAD